MGDESESGGHRVSLVIKQYISYISWYWQQKKIFTVFRSTIFMLFIMPGYFIFFLLVLIKWCVCVPVTFSFTLFRGLKTFLLYIYLSLSRFFSLKALSLVGVFWSTLFFLNLNMYSSFSSVNTCELKFGSLISTIQEVSQCFPRYNRREILW